MLKNLNKISAYFFLIIFLIGYIQPSFSYPSNRPTDAAVNKDYAYCSTIWSTLGGCLAAYEAYRLLKNTATRNYIILACPISITAYGLANDQQTKIVNETKHAKVINHLDLNEDYFNDFAHLKPAAQNCAELLDPGKEVCVRLERDANGEVALEGGKAKCAQLVGFCDGSTVLCEKNNLINLHDLKDEGCELKQEGNVSTWQGNVRELFDYTKYCKGVYVEWGNKKKCIAEASCEEFSQAFLSTGLIGAPLVCAYEVDDLICAEAVTCSWSTFTFQIDTSEMSQISEDIVNKLVPQFRYASVGGGYDPYSMSNSKYSSQFPQVSPDVPGGRVLCEKIIELSTSYTAPEDCKTSLGYCAEASNGPICSYSDACDATCNKKCDIHNIHTISGCRKIKNCIPSTDGRIGECQQNTNKQYKAGGAVYDPRYLAHCTLKENRSFGGPITPTSPAISPYCSGMAEVGGSDLLYKVFGLNSFAGRVVRCFDQTFLNIFWGSRQTVDTDTKKVVGTYCVDEPGVQVEYPSKCKSGIFGKAQIYMKNVVRYLIILSIVFVGIMIAFGVFKSAQDILKFGVLVAIVMYFAMADGWRDGYYRGLTTIGYDLGNVILNASIYTNPNIKLGPEVEAVKSRQLSECVYDPDSRTGPAGKDFVYTLEDSKYAIWDVLDCHGSNILGFSKADKASEIFKYFFKNIWYFIMVFIFCVFFFIIFFYTVLYIMMKFIFMILVPTVAIILLLFISPLVMPFLLFYNSKLRGIFDNWLKMLIGFSLQPIFIFAIMAIFFIIFEFALYGKADEVLKMQSATEYSVPHQIKVDCNTNYIPCIINTIKSAKDNTGGKTIDSYVIATVPADMFKSLIGAVIKLGFTMLVLCFVLYSVEGMISKLLGLPTMPDAIASAVKAAASGTLKIASSTTKGGLKTGWAATKNVGRRAKKTISKNLQKK
jgi:hypothetical protein